METLQIKKEAALEAHGNAKKSGKKMLEDLFGKKTFLKEVTDRIKSFDDVLNHLGIDHCQFRNTCIGLSADEIAYRKIKLIAQVLNEGWTPDWHNSSEYKYVPWFKMNGSSGSGFSCDDYDVWDTDSRVGSRLCFKSRDLAEYAGKQFLDLYRDYFVIS